MLVVGGRKRKSSSYSTFRFPDYFFSEPDKQTILGQEASTRTVQVLLFKFTDCFKFFSRELGNTLKVHLTYWRFQLVPRVNPFFGEGGGMTLESNVTISKKHLTRDESFLFCRCLHECRLLLHPLS